MQAGTEIIIGGEFFATGEFHAFIEPGFCLSFSQKMASNGNYSNTPENTYNSEITKQSVLAANRPIGIYPNPTSGIFTLSIQADDPVQQIYYANSSIANSNNASTRFNNDVLANHPAVSLPFASNVSTLNKESISSDHSNNSSPDIESYIYIYDVLGNLIYNSQLQNAISATIDISNHGKGVYFVRVVQGDKIFTEKLIHQ
jgi:hypothetical protein